MAQFSILFQNDEILLINKAAGVSVQGGEGILHPLDKELSAQVGYQVHLVHRLDKDTSGLLLVAKTSSAAAKWTRLIGEKFVKKTYTAFCLGQPLVNGKKTRSGSLKSSLVAHGKSQTASLSFTVEDECKLEEGLSLYRIRVTLGTGRMHQIRIQLSQVGAPLAADDKHGDFKANKIIRKLGIKKLCLAATELVLPLEGENRTFKIPLPDHMAKIEELYFHPSKSANT